MRYNLTDKCIFTGQETFIRWRGDEFWDYICDETASVDYFRMSDLIPVVMRKTGLRRATVYKYLLATLHNVALDDPDCPVIEKKGQTWFYTLALPVDD